MRQKRNKTTRFLATLCVLIMLLSSCGEKNPRPAETDGSGGTGASVKHPTEGVALLLQGIADGETVFNARKIDLPMEKDEFLYDVVAEEDGYRIVVGYIDEENYPRPFCTNGPVYVSEYRYLDKEYREDASRREPSLKGTTRSLARIGEDILAYAGLVRTEQFPNIDAPNGYDEYYWGEKYSVFKNDQGFYQPLISYDGYLGIAQMTAQEDTLYMVANRDRGMSWDFYVNDHIVNKRDDLGSAGADPCGVMSIGGTPYLFLSVSEGYSSTSWKGGVLTPLDPGMTEYGIDGIKLEANPTGLCATDGTLGYFLCGSELWYTDGETCGKLFDYANAGLSGEDTFRRILPLSDGRILTVAENMLIELTPVPKAEEVLRKTIVIGVVGTPDDDLVMRIGTINRSQSEYGVTIRKFSDRANLNLALLTKEISMIASKDVLMLRQYADKGILADLEETVPELYEDGVLYKSIVDAARWKGKSWFIPRNYSLWGFTVSAESGKTESDLNTPDKFYGYIEKEDTIFRKQYLKTNMLRIFGRMLDEWIDWEKGTSHFDDGSFAQVLTFCGGCAGSQDEVNLYGEKRGNVVFWPCHNFQDFSFAVEDGKIDCSFLIPWPSDVHQGFAVCPYYLLTIVKGQEEGSAEFLRYTFLKDILEYDANSFFPPDLTFVRMSVNREEEEHVMNAEREYNIAHELRNWWKAGYERTVEVHNEMIERASFYDYGDNEILDVIISEAGKYFAGEITAEKAAEYVQNRVSIYLAEQG